MTFTELVVNEQDQLCERTRLPGENEIGMVAWRMRFRTPEFTDGRDVIVIANDITTLTGTFGPKEDSLYQVRRFFYACHLCTFQIFKPAILFPFQRAMNLARSERIPCIHIAANSGARIGLAEEIKPLFRIAWENPQDPDMVTKNHTHEM